MLRDGSGEGEVDNIINILPKKKNKIRPICLRHLHDLFNAKWWLLTNPNLLT